VVLLDDICMYVCMAMLELIKYINVTTSNTLINIIFINNKTKIHNIPNHQTLVYLLLQTYMNTRFEVKVLKNKIFESTSLPSS